MELAIKDNDWASVTILYNLCLLFDM
jgi:hypothetical protein